jgi:iterative type I PKS product template protein
MSGRFPGAADVEEFWDVLKKGRDMHKEIPADRFDAQAHCDPSGKARNASHTPYGCFVDNPGHFDPRFFNMSPREATQTDPMQRLALITAYEALEMSGYVANRTPSTKLERIGTFYGQTSDDWREINEAQDIDTYFITGGVRAFGPGRINYYFKFTGPSFSVDTACSSSMAALHTAVNCLKAGDCDTAITGGVNIMTNPDIFSGLSKGQFLSKTGSCKTFDDGADGYCRGDGVATVILKRLEDAEADGDNILGSILSVATNHSANAVSITHPHAETQAVLYEKVVRDAGVDPLDINYVEMHGTGTQAGDGCEMQSVTDVFAPAHRQRRPDQPLYLSSVKANIGHGEAVSGVSALVKILLMLRKNAIPPHAGIKGEINKGFPKDLAMRNVRIPLQETPLLRKNGEKRQIFINNFSAAGGNTAIVVEDGPIRQITGKDPRAVHTVAVTARALSSIKAQMQSLIGFLDRAGQVDLPSLAYTTTARRTQHNYRISFLVKDTNQLRDALLKASSEDVQPVDPSTRVAFTFTGQGSHYAGLAADLFETSKQFQEDMTRFNFLAVAMGYPSILSLIHGSADEVAKLSPLCVQVALCSIQMALANLWAAWGIKPNAVIGHSLGEYAALYTAGVISASDAIFLVGERARLLQKHCTPGTHAMVAVKAPVKELSSVMTGCGVEVACINGTSETVLSGTTSAIALAKDLMQHRGMKATQLNVPFAFHSSQVEAILPEFEAVASTVSFKKPNVPLISPLHGSVHTNTIDATYLSRHARETVNFAGAMQAGVEANVITPSTVWIELGPQPVSLNFVKSSLAVAPSSGASLRKNEPAWTTLTTTCSMLHNKGANIDWNEFHRDFNDSHKLLDLPAYSWALKNYWIDYKNNWCLTKGDVITQAAPSIPRPSTTTVHDVVEEKYDDTTGYLMAETDVLREDFKDVMSGHIINGVKLCPSTIYSDIGFTLAEYMYRKMHNLTMEDEVPGINVRDMEVPKPLIGDSKGGAQILKIECKADKQANTMTMRLYTGTVDHARCTIDFTDKAGWVSEWARMAYLIQDRMSMLTQRAENGEVDVLRKGTIYKLFGDFIQYSGAYQGLQRVCYDMHNLETAANVVMQEIPEGQNFTVAPYWIDSFGHLAGFTVNCSEDLDPKTQVYVSHGWQSLRFLRPIKSGGKYRSYVRMLPQEGKVLGGDVYLFEEDEIVAVIGGLKFQCIPRKVLDILLPNPAGTSKSTPVHKLEPKEQVISTIATTTAHGAPAQIAVVRKISVTSQVLDIIAEECGVALSELADSNSFVDLGVDSLMQLAISGRMREEIELDVHSTLFMEHPTVGALKAYFVQLDSDASSTEDDSPTPDDPGLKSDSGSSDLTPSPPRRSPTSEQDVYAPNDISQALAAIASQELGVDIQSKPDKLISDLDSQHIIPPVLAPSRSATSVILQGTPRTATSMLFIFPDGGGSATSYMDIPRLSPSLCVYGLNSPYMKTPHEWTEPLEAIAARYIDEIQRRQPHGPYNVAGWSAGGVIAYEGTRQLIARGEKVARLVLLDAPCPLIIEPLPISLHRWFASIGMLGDGEVDLAKLPEWLLPHFQASITALSNYRQTVVPLEEGKQPKVTAIWCEDGVCKTPEDPRPEPYPEGHALFLLDNRTDFGPGQWEKFCGLQNMNMERVRGNHFSMMKAPNVSLLE